MADRAADDFDFIRRRMEEIDTREEGKMRGWCAMRNGKGADACWCWRAGPNGSNLPCPPGLPSLPPAGESCVTGLIGKSAHPVKYVVTSFKAGDWADWVDWDAVKRNAP